MPSEAQLASSSSATPDGHPEHQDWIASSLGQQQLAQVHAFARQHDADLLGLATDHVNRRVVVVVDPALDPSTLDSIRQDARARRFGLRVDVEPGCNAKADLEHVRDALRADSTTRYKDLAYSFYVDPATGRVEALVAEESAAKDISARFGQLVAVQYVPGLSGGSGDRQSDVSPHYGDARIWINGGPGFCSSNFTYVNVLTARVMVTAGHCGPNGTEYSSGSLVGNGSNRLYNNGFDDMEQVWAAGQTYTNKIYTDPCCPSTRSVVGKITPQNGTFVCVGGSTTLSQCGTEVYNSNATACYDGICAVGQWTRRAVNQGYICNAGDSGGVIYQRSGTNNAIAAGMFVAYVHDGTPQRNPYDVYGYYVCFFQTVARIEANYGLSVLTSP